MRFFSQTESKKRQGDIKLSIPYFNLGKRIHLLHLDVVKFDERALPEQSFALLMQRKLSVHRSLEWYIPPFKLKLFSKGKTEDARSRIGR